MSRRRQTVVVVGDRLVAGHGDGRGLGWVGRVAARTYPSVPDADFFTLATTDEDSSGLAARCMEEASRRFSDQTENRLVIGLGSADTESGISVARARLNVANILDSALTAEVQTFVVGPTPVRDGDRNRRLAEFNTGFTDVAHRRGIPYVDTFTPLRSHPVWQRELASTRTGTPAQEGYGLLAWLVLHRGWFEWFGVADALGED
ncbi:GDSL-type esterase/lipase family protein [Brevibacterium yomogidense]|uniref:GDSL-type esterase/lipase family protein n=1 Tax=Brevibacterium yomogidense TaxID=946573 RepID=UPI0018E00F4E|nr:GDSL-type esterase/lipase family protein [Brevibacterium yomogidense]